MPCKHKYVKSYHEDVGRLTKTILPGVSVTVAPLSWKSAPCAGTPSRLSTAWYDFFLVHFLTQHQFHLQYRWLVTPGIALSLPLLSHRPAPLVLWWRPLLSNPWTPRNLLSFSLLRTPPTPQLKTLHINLNEAECQHLSDFYCCFVTLYN